MAVGSSEPAADARTSFDHVVARVTSFVVRFVVVVVATSGGRLDRPASWPAAALPVDDLPRLYLAAGLTGRLTCPFEEEPPNRLVVWTKDGNSLDPDGSTRRSAQPRVRFGRGGTLVFIAASAVDEGVYSCLVYSPLHPGPESPSVQVLVRGT